MASLSSSPSIGLVTKDIPSARSVDLSISQAVHGTNEIYREPTSSTPAPICNIRTPVGMLGFGLNTTHSFDALAKKAHNGAPTAIILDSGSTDSGPEKLALGKLGVPRECYVRDLKKLIKLSWQFRVPLVFSSAGGDGSDEHVREMTAIVKKICESDGNL
jgi:hypothetical protein